MSSVTCERLGHTRGRADKHGRCLCTLCGDVSDTCGNFDVVGPQTWPGAPRKRTLESEIYERTWREGWNEMQREREKQPMKIYLIGSLREPTVPAVAERLRADGFEIFDDWHGAGPKADDEWMHYEKNRGRTYGEALAGYNAEHVFSFDKKHLDRCDAAVLVGPAGKSAHLELGYMIGTGKPGYILLDGEPERWDVMYKFATRVCFDLEVLADTLARLRRSHDVFGPKVMS